MILVEASNLRISQTKSLSDVASIVLLNVTDLVVRNNLLEAASFDTYNFCSKLAFGLGIVQCWHFQKRN